MEWNDTTLTAEIRIIKMVSLEFKGVKNHEAIAGGDGMNKTQIDFDTKK